MKLCIVKAGVMFIEEKLFIDLIFSIQDWHLNLYKCEMKILCAEAEPTADEIEVEIKFMLPHYVTHREEMDARLQKNKLRLFKILRIYLYERVLDLIERENHSYWQGERLAVLMWAVED